MELGWKLLGRSACRTRPGRPPISTPVPGPSPASPSLIPVRGFSTGDKLILVTRSSDTAGNLQNIFAVPGSSNTIYISTNTPTVSNVQPNPVSLYVNSFPSNQITGSFTRPTRPPPTMSPASSKSVSPATSTADQTPPPGWEQLTEFLGQRQHLGCRLCRCCLQYPRKLCLSHRLPISWSDGSLYRISARVTDTAGNITPNPASETVGFNAFFVYDVSFPTSAITSITNATWIQPPATITGTALDNYPRQGWLMPRSN